jgi:hypothetical protein
MDKFNSFYGEDIPVCRFGPGGDFVQDWPVRLRSGQADTIGKILKTIAKMLDTAITTKLLQNSTIEKINLAVNGGKFSTNAEDEIDVDKSDKPDTQTAPGTQTCRKLSEKPMLFDNASGAGRPVRHKPVNGVRAHHRPKRKRTSFSTVRQGSLFEPYPESSKVA